MAKQTAEIDLGEFEVGAGGSGKPCLVGNILGRLDDEHQAKLQAALAAEKPGGGNHRWQFTGERIAAVVTGWGQPVSSGTVDRHRRRACGCGQ